jgi:uncharacterized NAD(P)/FAD-binding protein YdhS
MEARSYDADVAIVGAGFCGATLAMRLAGEPSIRTTIFERDRFARGVAYSTTSPRHVLNQTTARMSPFPETPDHFTRWLEDVSPNAYVPRSEFARYLRSTFDAATAQAPHITRRTDSVISIVPSGGGFAVTTERETTFARYVVLAVGNFPPGNALVPQWIRTDAKYFPDPWTTRFEELSGDVLFIGNGLTAIDALVEVQHRGRCASVTMLSRHGRNPEMHRAYGAPIDVPLDRRTAAGIVRSARRAIAEIERDGGDWRAVVDGIRPLSQSIWHAWPLAEQRRFLRHVRPFWESSRRRVPPEVAAVVDAASSTGRLRRVAGRLQTIEKLPNERYCVTIARADTMTSLEVNAIVNCTGPQVNVLQIDDPLIRSLLATGLIAPHATRMGIAANADGSIVDAHGIAHENFFALGSLLRGAIYETTAVPELRVHVRSLADRLLATFAAVRA